MRETIKQGGLMCLEANGMREYGLTGFKTEDEALNSMLDQDIVFTYWEVMRDPDGRHFAWYGQVQS